MAALSGLDWGCAIFARNEESRIGECIRALARAGEGMRVRASVFVNGSSDRTAERATAELKQAGLQGDVYRIAAACKWNAMNAFIHELRPHAKMYAFVDATAFIGASSLCGCASEFKNSPGTLVIGAVPSNGRSASRMRAVAFKSGGIGQFFAVRRELLEELVARGRHIPIGLYRGDGLLSAFIVHETNDGIHREPMRRVGFTPAAEYSIRPLSPFSWHDIKVYYNRLVRQARGRVENQAWNSVIWSRGFDALPRFGDELILTWLKDNSPRDEGPLGHFFIRQALKHIRKWHKPREEDLIPVLIASI